MRVLVTGGSGMVGGAIVEACARQRPQLEILAPTRAELDLRDRSAVERMLAATRPQAIVHCAARVGGIHANLADAAGFLTDNVHIDLAVLEGAMASGIRELIYFGSSCMYPRDRDRPLSEDDLLTGELEPTNEGYALAKLMGARLCGYLSAQHGVAYRVLVAPNLYGPGDHYEPDRSHMVAAAIRKVADAVRGGAPAIEVWGDGTARREFLYVRDLAEFAVERLDRLRGLPPVLNVGCGEDHSVLGYYRRIAEIAGFGGRLETDASLPAGMRRKLMDSSRARNLGWSPRTSLLEGLSRTYRDYVALTGERT